MAASVEISLEKLQGMSVDERWDLIDSGAIRAKPDVETCTPNFIGPLYRNIPFPHYDTVDGTSILLDVDNIFNGTLVDYDEMDKVTMTWKGYTSQQYDGSLKLGAVNAQSVISGTCNGIYFRFQGVKLVFGCWPGFLELYKAHN